MRPNIRSPEDVRTLAQEIIDLLDAPFDIQGRPVTLSIGIGIALGPRDGPNTEELSKKAAIALHEAKAAEQFKEKTLPLRVATALSNAGLAPARLEIEITESVLLDDSEANLACMRALKLLGVKIALDDFGIGYSSLAYLQRFPFDRIKIDKSFVNELVVREETKAIIRAVIGLGQSLGMRITAKGIETEEQLARIRAKGCSEAQGFLFSRAVPAIEIPGVLERFSGSRPPLHPIGREDNTFLSRA